MPSLTVNSANSPYTISQTTSVGVLVIQAGGVIVAPDGKEVTLTVKGVEMGGVLESTAGVKTLLSKPGLYKPALLTVTDQNLFVYAPAGPPGTPTVTFPFRQALYLDATGVVDAKSVPAAVFGPKPVAPLVKNVSITSLGEDFDAIFVAGGAWNIVNPKIRLTGNGRSDFSGYGSAIVVDGADTSVVIDKANIVNQGVARSAIVAEGSASVVVKNSYLETKNGTLPSDYIPTIDTAQMRSVPWMLSLSGNVRTTNLLGANTDAAAPAGGKNMYIELNKSALRGQVSASEAHHSQADIGAADYRLLGEVTNTPHQVINNGVWLQLNSSCWTVTGTCYLTELGIDAASRVVAPFGHKLVVTVDDDFDGANPAAPVTLMPGTTYTGYITITVAPI